MVHHLKGSASADVRRLARKENGRGNLADEKPNGDVRADCRHPRQAIESPRNSRSALGECRRWRPPGWRRVISGRALDTTDPDRFCSNGGNDVEGSVSCSVHVPAAGPSGRVRPVWRDCHAYRTLRIGRLGPATPGDYDRRRDAGRTADVLYGVPLCVASDDLSDGVPAATDVQVLCPDLLAGSKIAVTGRLLGAHTGNGHTPVLLVCPAYYQPARLRPLPLRGGSV